MLSVSLDPADWTFRAPTGNRWLPARVPGCIHTDLLRHGLIPDPFWGRNELDLQWIEERDWTYRGTFRVPVEIWAESHIELVFEGLDTFATVTLNGAPILTVENMFHRHRVDVRTHLRRGVNRLEIRFRSALAEIRGTRPDFLPREFNDPVGGCARIRKQQCQFGWDWGPRFVTAGIWRPVRLEAWSGNRITSVHLTQIHKNGTVTLRARPETAVAGGRWRLTATRPGETPLEADGTELTIPDPQLWWPAGQGSQPLYTVTLELLDADGRSLDVWRRRIGLRTIVLDQDPDAFAASSGGSHPLNRFGLRVNGRLIFAKGANWIPAHSFVAGLERPDYEPLLRSAAAAHMNLIRLWGGGIYERDAFYALCDELGLLVWHDHLFACTRYPADPAFLASVRREVTDQVRRIRHHACLALWCGNNETVMLNRDALAEPKAKRDYVRLFLETIPAVLRAEDPATPYLHSSPRLGLDDVPSSHTSSRDEHDWDVWHARKPVEHYLTKSHRFVSEFGMQSFPSLPVARTFCPPAELDILSPTFQNHQKNAGGNAIILDYVARLYRYPRDYGSLAYLSQLNQAHCMKVAIEHFRRQQPMCLGAVYWQLNDCWPVASWSSLEFGGRWKVLHHTARRFFAPSLVSARHLGEETVTLGNYNRNTKGVVELWTSHDAPETRRARLEWRLVTLDGRTLATDRRAVVLRPLESRRQKTLDLRATLDHVGRDRAVLHLELRDAGDDSRLSENTVLFCAPRLLAPVPTRVRSTWKSVAPGVWDLTLRSGAVQLGVWLEFADEGVTADDNGFDLLPDVPRTVRVTTAARRRAARPAVILRTIAEPGGQ